MRREDPAPSQTQAQPLAAYNCSDQERHYHLRDHRQQVFVIQERPERNIVSAQKFGQLTPIISSRKQVVLSAAPTISIMKKVLKDFNDDDYLLLMGDPAAIGYSMLNCFRYK